MKENGNVLFFALFFLWSCCSIDAAFWAVCDESLEIAFSSWQNLHDRMRYFLWMSSHSGNCRYFGKHGYSFSDGNLFLTRKMRELSDSCLSQTLSKGNISGPTKHLI